MNTAGIFGNYLICNMLADYLANLTKTLRGRFFP